MENVSKAVPGLGIKLGQLRTNKNISQDDMAKYIGISRPNYTAIENGHDGRFLKDYQLKNLAEKLNVSTDYLLGLIADPNPQADIRAITKALGISSKTVQKIQEISILYNSSEILETYDDFMNFYNNTFWGTMNFYKKIKEFYENEYNFVKDFTKEIYFRNIGFNELNIDINEVCKEYKYFYVNKDLVENYNNTKKELFNNSDYDINEKIKILISLIEQDKISEDFIFLSRGDKEKIFREDLLKVKNLIKELLIIVDHDDTGLTFSFSERADEIEECINQLIEMIDQKSNECIDNVVEALWCALSFLAETTEHAMSYIKFRISNLFGEFLDSF